jgi:hypothetical protein
MNNCIVETELCTLKRATGGKDAAFTGTLGSVPLHVEAAILAAGDDGFQPSVSWFQQYRHQAGPP